ncbi:MAG: hypothetical protein CEN91_354 [Candidatus Berkelbacteria bacterium Licking1014_85]|uniref:Type 4 fimbrial biogenesis protein PilX N-terminal domain-containing protein n=1 Tax=Candidatus Berkelbacteria bacterium Licking1014_85 TaxID=2017148 RepID=A0A554LJ46_9BACT|nr:MAG: hypothetical protein CEN91_354 [Candidatus Berkelbacteria bacterium Licking1014_85]
MNYNHKKQKGSALIIALLIISTLAVVSFGSNRIFLSALKTSDLYAQTPFAYYAAESGLEKALLDYKENNDIEREIIDSEINSVAKQTYSLIRTYKGSQFGGDDVNNDNYKITKDDYKEIDLTGLSGTIDITWSWSDASVGKGIEFITVDNLNRKVSLPQETFPPDSDYSYTVSQDDIKLRIIPRGSGVNGLKAVIHEGGQIDSGIYTITSTGKYQNTNRKLQATIDRRGGTLLNIFDFALYAVDNIE